MKIDKKVDKAQRCANEE